ncbi:hypothetical protein D9M68_635390 [compost metagenome]
MCPVERAQLLQADILQLLARTQHGPAKTLPRSGGSKHLLPQCPERVVLGQFQLTQYHFDFGLQVRLVEPRVEHAISLKHQQMVQLVRIGGQKGHVAGAVETGGRIELDATPTQPFDQLRPQHLGCALE